MTLIPLYSSTLATDVNQEEVPTGSYALDPAHTIVGFEVPHLVISSIEGRFKKFEGTLLLNPKLSDLKIEVNIDIDSIDTADINRDAHLKSADFFDADKFPTMTFVSSSFTGTPYKLIVNGKLTIKNISKDVVFDAKMSKEITDPWGKKRIALSAMTKINRQDFGLTWNNIADVGQVVGDEITILVKAEAIKK